VDLLKQTLALYTKNEWPSFKGYNIREFTKLIGQHEQAWKPAREELETINVGNEKN